MALHGRMNELIGAAMGGGAYEAKDFRWRILPAGLVPAEGFSGFENGASFNAYERVVDAHWKVSGNDIVWRNQELRSSLENSVRSLLASDGMHA
jgi:hypothetical protein